MHDVAIIGGGPAGLTAAIYTSRAGLKTLLLESMKVSSQATTASDVENYPGFPEGISGIELMGNFKKQAAKFGTEFKTKEVKKITEIAEGGKKAYRVDAGGENMETLSVIIASGAQPRKLGVPGEEKFTGRGVSYCAICDGAFFKGKEILVVGGGDTAIEEAIFLTKFGRKVTVVHRRDRLRAARILQERALNNKKIHFIWDSTVTEILGGKAAEKVKIKNIKTGKESGIPADGIFMLVGYTPNTGFLKGFLELDEKGYIVTAGGVTTKKDGIFAAGDARVKSFRQMVTASGDGAEAAHAAQMYVDEMKGQAYK